MFRAEPGEETVEPVSYELLRPVTSSFEVASAFLLSVTFNVQRYVCYRVFLNVQESLRVQTGVCSTSTLHIRYESATFALRTRNVGAISTLRQRYVHATSALRSSRIRSRVHPQNTSVRRTLAYTEYPPCTATGLR